MLKKISEELLDLFDSLLRSQLNTIKQLRKAAGYHEPEPSKGKRMSHMDMVYDILTDVGHPQHVDDLISALAKKFTVTVDKESLVSALTKRVARHDRFMKIAPNTFALLSEKERGGKA